MMLRKQLTACSAAPKLSATLKSRAFSTLRSAPRRFATSPLAASTITFAAVRANPSTSLIPKQLARGFQQTAFNAPTASPSFLYRAAMAGGVFAGTAVLIQFLNRETREGAIPEHQKAYLNDTFVYTGAGVAMIGFAAKALHNIGWSYRIMMMNPLMFAGLSLAGGIGTMIATRMTPPENFVLKHTLWAGFNLSQAAVLSPLFFYHPALIARAGLYTVSLMGGLCFVGATAKTDQYLWLGGPLMAGMGVVLVSGLAPMILPMGAGALALSEKVFMYGSLAVFSGFTLYDTQKILKHGELAHRGLMKRDPVNESISLELDFINIFVRMVHILGNRNQRK